MKKKIMSVLSAVGLCLGLVVATSPSAQAQFVEDRYPLLWASECPQKGGDRVITWRTNSRALRVPMVKKILDDLDANMSNVTFKQVSWYNRRAQITVAFSTKLKSGGVAYRWGTRYSKYGDLRRVLTRSPFRSYNDSVVEFILRHELWHALGANHQPRVPQSLMQPYWGWASISNYNDGITPNAADYSYINWVNNNCNISVNVARSRSVSSAASVHGIKLDRFKEREVFREGSEGGKKSKFKTPKILKKSKSGLKKKMLK